ncbi:hypothetical protein CTEN210_04473 [Chaetoceros tenuissimus]|uniref:Uncharacterized protein n=1 Tax=Chaetoceros tenuissimus TaxID=426638 RepID=A0AAD3CKY8_9STRA|nr:hypothetical protein CTEN210_04473 [Chaetoceros tenuissimus]
MSTGDDFHECVDIENDEFHSVHSNSSRSNYDFEILDSSIDHGVSDTSVRSSRSGYSSSSPSRSRVSVTMYGNDFKLELTDASGPDSSEYTSNASQASGSYASGSDDDMFEYDAGSTMTGLSGYDDDDGEHHDSDEDSGVEVQLAATTKTASDDDIVQESDRKPVVVSPARSILSGDMNDMRVGMAITEETPPRSNASGIAAAPKARRATTTPSKSLFTGELLTHIEDSQNDQDEGSAGTLSTQDSLLGKTDVRITPSFANESYDDFDAENINAPPSMNRHLNDDDYSYASTLTDSSAGTSDSFYSVMSDMSKIRSLIRGEMESVASSKSAASTGSQSAVNRSLESDAMHMIAETWARIEAEEKAEKAIKQAEEEMKSKLTTSKSAEDFLKEQIAKINQEVDSKVLDEETDEILRAALPDIDMDDEVSFKTSKTSATSNSKPVPEDDMSESEKRQIKMERAEETKKRKAEEEKAIQESVARATVAAATLKKLEGEATVEHAKKEARLKAEKEAAKIKMEEEAAKLKKQEEAARLKAAEDEEKARIAAEEEAARLIEEARIKAEEEEKARIAAEKEAARIKAEEEEKARIEAEKAAEEERLRIEAEKEAARIKAEEEEKARIEAEKAAEEERLRIEAEKEAARIKAEEEEKARIEAEKAAEEERLRIEAEKEAARIKAEEEEKARIEAEKAAEEERLRIEAEKEAARIKAEEEEKARIEAEKAAEEERLRIEAEKEAARIKAEEEEKARIEAEKAAEEERLRIEAEKEAARIKAEEEEKARIEAEKEAARIKAEEEEKARIAAEEEAARIKAEKAEEEERLRIEKEEEAARVHVDEEKETTELSTEDEESKLIEAARIQAAEEEDSHIEEAHGKDDSFYSVDSYTSPSTSPSKRDNTSSPLAGETDDASQEALEPDGDSSNFLNESNANEDTTFDDSQDDIPENSVPLLDGPTNSLVDTLLSSSKEAVADYVTSKKEALPGIADFASQFEEEMSDSDVDEEKEIDDDYVVVSKSEISEEGLEGEENVETTLLEQDSESEGKEEECEEAKNEDTQIDNDEKEDDDAEGDDQNSPQKSTQSGGTLETCESPTTQITSQTAQSTQTAVETVPQSTTASTIQPAAATRAATNPLQKDMVDPHLEAAACGCCTIS